MRRITTDASAPPRAADHGSDRRYVVRALLEPEEIVSMLRLRHRIYFEEKRYGAPKPLGLDLTAHDERCRLFGVFLDSALIGGMRLVYRNEQAANLVFRAVRAVASDARPLPSSPLLPSEEAFDLSRVPGLPAPDVRAEFGRLVLDGHAGVPWVLAHTITAGLAALYAEGCPLYMYSCAASLAKRYARVVNPTWTLNHAASEGIRSDGFVFPKPTIAAIARPEDAALGASFQDYVQQLNRSGAIVLSREPPAVPRP